MRYIIVILFSLVTLVSCGEKKEPDAHGTEEHHDDHGPNEVTLTPEQMKTVGIELGTIEMKNLKASISANGLLKVPNQNKAHVTPLYSGVVRSLFVQPGNSVRKGQAIATIVNTELASLQQDYLEIASQIELTETELKRQKELVEGNAAPLKRLQQVEAELRSLKARRAGLTEQLRVLGFPLGKISADRISSVLTVTAPISGTVSTVLAEIGSNVDPSSPIAEIVNNSQLHLDLFVYEKDLPLLAKDQVIHFTLTNNPRIEYDAKIYSIGTAFESETKTIAVHALVLGDKTGLIEGMNITAVISIGDATVPAVPVEAIVTAQGQDYIFIEKKEAAHDHPHDDHAGDSAHAHEDHDEHNTEAPHVHKEGEAHHDEHAHKDEHGHEEITFERIPIRKGVTNVGYAEITPLKELPPGVRIVSKGAFFLLAKMTNAGEAHQH